ncbi:hypothetical protein DAKH74_010040 [Maudiozyma humilis]|uniref:Uncharacterized protein n=1 Tax=Maudiozyma humilis TaxID=51915 RepID=A0AAV5RUI7_MAUHU|nr:hypothetical protein DAKH74_010040 [Kazachstania humilis]
MTDTATYIDQSSSFLDNYNAYCEQHRHAPVVLDRQVLFGTPETIETHAAELRDANVRFFIGVDIPTAQMAQLYGSDAMAGLYGSRDDIVVTNFDSQFRDDLQVSDLQQLSAQVCADPALVAYLWNNSHLMRLMAKQLADSNDMSQCLHRYANAYRGANAYTLTHTERFQAFNDLLTLFHMTNPQGRVLVLAESHTAESMLALLISTLLKRDTQVRVQQAYQFVMSLLDTAPAQPVRTERIFLNAGLTGYVEAVKKFNAIHGRRRTTTTNYGAQSGHTNETKRSMRYVPAAAQLAPVETGKRARAD